MLKLKHFFTNHILTSLFLFSYMFLLVFVNPAFASSDPTNPWTSSPNVLPYSLSTQVVGGNNNLFIVGGANSDDYSLVNSSTENPSDGSISSWTQSLNGLPETRYASSVVNFNNNIYLLGGRLYDGQQHSKNTVYLSKIQPNGTITAWQSLTNLPNPLALGGAVVTGGKLYYAGGSDNQDTKYNDIYVADINQTDGTIGAWSTAGHLPVATDQFGMVAYGNNIIIVGGRVDPNNIHVSTVYKASVDPSTGLVSGWITMPPLPQVISASGVIVVGSTLLSVGGETTGLDIKKVYYANLDASGNFSSWQTSANDLPEPVGDAPAVYLNGYLYLTGGYDNTGSGYLNTVYYTRINNGSSSLLNVPLLKQTDPSWGSLTYDSADVWAPPKPTDISTWGCALTSAAMIFKYYGITKLPNSIDLNPGTLNVYLKNDTHINPTKDGYIAEGYVNWVELSNISKLAKSQNPLFSHDSLEFYAADGFDSNLLTQDIQAGRPDILQVKGPSVPVSHFIVADGIDDSNNFLINDPFFNRTSLSIYNNSSLAMKRFIPANSDLSYLVLFTQSDVAVDLEDSGGNSMGVHTIEYPISNPAGAGSNGKQLKAIYFSKPASGNYTVSVSSQTNSLYNIIFLAYDINGQHKKFLYSGIVGPQNTDNYSILFSKNNNEDDLSSQNVTFDSFIADINTFSALDEIKLIERIVLVIQAETAKSFGSNSLTHKVAINMLNALKKEVDNKKENVITQVAVNILDEDISSLIQMLSQ